MAGSWYHTERGQYHQKIDNNPQAVSQAVSRAAKAVREADFVLITTGAGMGCDSNVPDFRGGQSFWDGLSHPEIQKYEDMSDDAWFTKDPALAWGLNMHQIKTFREATPHEGYSILHRICESKGHDAWFSWTSNVDGMFIAAGFDPERVLECHGQIHRLQCTQGRHCGKPEGLTLREDMEWNTLHRNKEHWVSDGTTRLNIEYDANYRAVDMDVLPRCPECGCLARPNIWFCKDRHYTPYKHGLEVSTRYQEWRERIRNEKGCKVAVIECGGGTVIPSVRCEGEILLEESQEENSEFECTLIRINPTDFGVPTMGGIGLPLGAADGLSRIEALL